MEEEFYKAITKAIDAVPAYGPNGGPRKRSDGEARERFEQVYTGIVSVGIRCKGAAI